MLLEIDYRESKIIKLLENNVEFKDYKTKTCNLPIGDFIIKGDDDEIFYIIERKTIDDLMASISDNRLRDQKQRLLESSNDSLKIIFIIEGEKKVNNFSRIPLKTINSCILNLIFKHNFHVIFTESLDDTLENVMLLLNKIQTKDLVVTSTNVKLIKKSDKTTQHTFINQLGVINGVSITIACKIKEIYTCMTELIKAFENDKTILTNLQITPKRKLGMKLNDKIYNSLFNT
jgi:ERCC4-type nuclease